MVYVQVKNFDFIPVDTYKPISHAYDKLINFSYNVITAWPDRISKRYVRVKKSDWKSWHSQDENLLSFAWK